MDLLYTQALVFFSIFFIPYATILGALTTLILFTAKAASLFIFLEPFGARSAYRMTSSDNFVWTLLLIFFIITVGFTGYVILWLKPSSTCGPFQGQDSAYDIIMDRAATWPQGIRDFFNFVVSGAFVVPLLLALL